MDMEGLGEYSEELIPLAVEHGLSVIGAITILIIGWIFANWASKKIKHKTSESRKFDDTLVPIFGQVVRILILIITILAVLGQFGVQTASLIAVLGAAGLAVGLALQGTLSNIAAGMMLLTLRPFKVGDAVDVGGTVGIVDAIGLFITEMHTFDNIGVIMPNSKVWGSEIKNMSKFAQRRADMVFGIGYGDDMDKAMRLIKEVLDEDERVLGEPEPMIVISNLGDSSVDITVRAWTDTPNVWPLRFAVTKKVKERFDANGVSIPFPQRDVHLFKEN